MENSPYSNAFKKQFDTLSDDLVHAIDEHCSYAKSNDNGTLGEIGLDILQLTSLLHLRKTELKVDQYALLSDLYEYIVRSDAEYTPEDFKIQINELCHDETLQEIPTRVLDLLRNYDAEYKTQHALAYKKFLSGLLKATLSLDKPDNNIIQECETVWSETVDAARAEDRILFPESKMLINEINKGLKDFVEPIMKVRESHQAIKEIDSLNFVEYGIRADLRHYCIGAIFVDSVIDEGELDLLYDLAPTFMLNGQLGNRAKIESILNHMFKQQKELNPGILPLIINLLDAYDSAFGTDFGDEARALYFRLVNTVFKSDGHVCEEETEWLTQFKETLYPQGDAELVEHDYKKHGKAKQRNEASVKESSLDESIEELNQLVALDQVKEDMHQLINFIKVQSMREEKGLPASRISKYFVFAGNPGTGKTSIARILANIYRSQGILEKGQLVETHPNEMVANDLSDTTKNVNKIVESALGGVLLIDDAFLLNQKDKKDFYGQEALDALLKAMESHKNDLVVILAGYAEKMATFINSNQSLKSQFSKYFNFRDYTNDELINIFDLFCRRSSFVLTDSANKLMQELLNEHYSERKEGFGNEREIRNIFECVIGNQANRVVSIPEVTEEILCTISDDDIKPILDTLNKEKGKSN